MLNRLRPLLCAVALTACAHAQTTAHPTPAVRDVLTHTPLMVGDAWYPEQWPESRWDADLALMEKAHLHVVRVGEFAWSTMEPSDGQFDFTWLDHAVALAAKHHIKVVLGTPTAAPPAWLTTKYPQTLRMNEDGRLDEHGNRQQFSFTDPTYRRLAARIAGKMAEHFGHNPNVLGWQLDNELAAPSFDPSAKIAFHQWLKNKYGTIGELNHRWATAYWSQTYDTFDEVPMHSHNENPALLLDYKRFVTDTWVSYCGNQIAAMRPHLDARQWITTNTMHWFTGFDHYKLHEALDLAAWDDYWPDGHPDYTFNAAEHDLVRGFKRQNFWLMETQPAFVNWGPVNAAFAPGVTRELAWQAIGHGADAVLYWQWRSAPNGQEEYHGVLVGADGQPVPVYSEIARLGEDVDRTSRALEGTSPHADVAMLQDYDSNWAIGFQKHTVKYDFDQQIVQVYRALAPAADGGVSSFDLLSPTADLSGYKAVFAPALNVLPEATAKNLLAYVEHGGLLVLGARSGMKDADNGLQPTGQPGPFSQALGAHVAQFYALDKPAAIDGGGQATVWAEDLTTTDPATRVLLRYGKGNGWLEGHPAAVAHSYGKGTIAYVGATLDDATLRRVLLPLIAERNIKPAFPDLPKDVEVMERSGNNHRVWIAINHGATPQTFDLHHTGTDLLQGKHSDGHFTLAPHDVAVFTPEGAR